MLRSKGQVSSLLKPIQVIIFASIFVTVLIVFLNFEIGLLEQESELDSDLKLFTGFQSVSSCLSVDKKESPAQFLLNQSKLERFERGVSSRQLPCAPMYSSSYNVTVDPAFTGSLSPEIRSEEPADVVFALDDSGSMGQYLNEVKQNTNKFIDALPQGSRVGMFTYASTCQRCTDWGLAQHRVDLTTDDSEVTEMINNINTRGGAEPEDLAIKHAIEGFDFDPGKRKIIIILATESATKDSATQRCGGAHPSLSCLKDWADEAANKEFEIYTIAENESKNEYSQIAERTGGKFFEVDEDYSKIFEEIAGDTVYAGGGNTCTLPPVERYNGTADFVFAADTSESFQSEWGTICAAASQTKNSLEDRGINVSVSVYSPGNRGNPENGLGSPMDVNGEPYNHTEDQRNVPDCVDSSFNDAVRSDYGKGITKWRGPAVPEYNSSSDYGYEAWGVMSKWILENHEWRDDAGKRMLFVFGDQVPTGGNESASSFKRAGNTRLPNGSAIVNEVIEKANNDSVEIRTFEGDDWEYVSKSQVSPSSKNDAEILQKRASYQTSGEHGNYSDAIQIPKEVAGAFKQVKGHQRSVGFCSDLKYSFGQESTASGQVSGGEDVLSYPVTIKHSDLASEGSMKIGIRRSDFSNLLGQIRKVIERGKASGEVESTRFRYESDRKVHARNYTVRESLESDYRLVGVDGNPEVNISDKFVIGVNGEEVGRWEKDQNQISVVADFSNSNSFKAYKGAHFQHIAVNRDENSGMKLEGFKIECLSCSNNAMQEIVPNDIDASKGSQEYKSRGGIGVFEHGSTEIEVGKQQNTEWPAICAGNTAENCNTFRVGSISEIDLEAGNYLLEIRYEPSNNRVVIND